MAVVKLNPRDVFGEVLLSLGKDNEKIMAVSCDSGSGSGMNPFKKALPDQYLEIGISEQNAIGICAGLAESGNIPVVSAIAPFISMRCFEQIRNDVGYANMNVKIVGSSSGLSHSNLGSTHQALEDMALLRTIPNMVIFNPGDGWEVGEALKKAVACKGPVYIRMPRHAMALPVAPEARQFEMGRGETLLDTGDEVAIFTTGTLSADALEAGRQLAKKGYGVKVVNFMTVHPLDRKQIRALYKKCRFLFTVEEHVTTGGFGAGVLSVVADIPGGAPVYTLGIQPGSIQTGPYRALVEDYGLSAEKLEETMECRIQNVLKDKKEETETWKLNAV